MTGRSGRLHVLCTATPFGGHQPPLVGLTRELVRRGHRVTYYTGAKYAPGAQRVGATWLPWHDAPDFDDLDVSATFPQVRDGTTALPGIFASYEHLFFGTGPAQLRDVRRWHDANPVDVVVGEQTSVAAPFLAESAGVPWATFSLSPLALTSRFLPPVGLPVRPARGPLGRARDAALRALVNATLGARMRTLLNRARADAGLGPTPLPGMDALYSTQLLLCQGSPALEYPRPDAPAALRFVGDAAAGTRTADRAPAWLAGLDDRPLVLITAGTLDVRGGLVDIGVRALADTDVQVVVAGDPARVPVAPNVVAVGWVPYDLVLGRTSVVVSNGGYGGVVGALARGVPVVVAPAGGDKPEVARRVARAGAGIDLHRAAPRPARLRWAVQRCLNRPEYAANAARIAAECARAGGAAAAATLVEDLAARTREAGDSEEK